MEGGTDGIGESNDEALQAFSLQLDELDDEEFDLPPVGTPPTLESILNERDDESMSGDDDTITQAQVDRPANFNQVWSSNSPDAASIASYESSESTKTKASFKRKNAHSTLFSRHGSVIKHVILRGVSSQIISASERVNVGKPSAMAVSNMIAIGTTHGIVLIFDVNQVMKWCLENHNASELHGSVSALAFNSDCSRLLVGHAKGLISKWDIGSGKLLQNIQDVHPIGTAVLHIYFIDDHTQAICSDSGGSVFDLSFKKNIAGRSCDSQCLFSGSRGEVCTLQPLIPNTYHDHPLKQYTLVAMASISKVIVIALKPSVNVLFSHPLKANQSTLPILNWQFVIIQMSNSKRVIDPVLTFGRDDTIYFFQATEVQPKSINFILLQKIKLSYTILNFSWLNSRTLAIFDTKEVMHIMDVRSEEALEELDLSSVNLVFNSSHFKALSTGGNVSKAMALIGERACYETVKMFNGQLLILGTRSVHVLTIRTWSERINYLTQKKKFKESLNLAFSIYEDKAKAVLGLSGPRHHKKKIVGTKIEDLIISYTKDFMSTHKDKEYSVIQSIDYFKEAVPLCVECCFKLDKMDLLLNEIYDLVDQNIHAKQIFLKCLEPYILNDHLTFMNPIVVKEFVDHYQEQHLFIALEACISHFDISSLDVHQIMTICWKHNLYDSIIYIYNQGMQDFVTPLIELLKILMAAVKTGKQLSDEKIRLGNKLFVYISCCLAGRGYLRGDIPSEIASKVGVDVFDVVTCFKVENSLDDDHEIYPYLKTLLKFDTREFLNVLSMAFTEEIFCNGSKGNNKQRLVDILLRIMVNGPDFSPLQVGALFTFLARQLAMPNSNIIVDRMLFEQVLEYLTNPGDELRLDERQQTLIDLHQAGGLKEIDYNKLLILAEKIKFFRICEVLYEEKRMYDKILMCYIRDPLRQAQVFTYIKHINASVKFSEIEKKSVETEFIEYIEEIVKIDGKKTAKLVMQIYPEILEKLIHKLQNKPETQYKFLLSIFHYREDTFKFTSTSSDNKQNQENENQQSDMDAWIHEQFIELMCQFERNNVAQHIKNIEGYRLEEALDICRQHEVMDAVAFLLEKAGDIQEAFKILMKDVSNKMDSVCKLIHGNMGKELKIEDSVEWGTLQTTLVFIIQFCQRNSPKLREQDREALWFPLFEALTVPQRHLKGELSIHIPAFKDQMRYLLNSMMGYIAVPAILEKIMKDPAYSSGKLGEIRDMIMGMLQTYSYEQTLLHLTNNLLCSDLHNHLSSLRKIASRGYSSHSNKCYLCRKLLSVSPSQVVIFRCGHSFHTQCIMDNKPNNTNLGSPDMWQCYFCNETSNKKSKSHVKVGSRNMESRSSQCASAYLQAVSKQPIMKVTPTKIKPFLDHHQIQALEQLRKFERTGSRLAVLSELSKVDSTNTSVHKNIHASNIFMSESFGLNVVPSGVIDSIADA